MAPPDGLPNLLTNLPHETVFNGLLSNVQLEFIEYSPDNKDPFLLTSGSKLLVHVGTLI